jgi:hypothetical protein
MPPDKNVRFDAVNDRSAVNRLGFSRILERTFLSEPQGHAEFAAQSGAF